MSDVKDPYGFIRLSNLLEIPVGVPSLSEENAVDLPPGCLGFKVERTAVGAVPQASTNKSISSSNIRGVAIRVLTERFDLKGNSAPNNEEELFEAVRGALAPKGA